MISDKLCKDTFKSLRERYRRAKLKHEQTGSKSAVWEHYEALKFLEPHMFKHDEKTDMNSYYFIKQLINFVYQHRPLWDRDSSDKHLKKQLWQKVAQELKVETGACMQKWKGLREKYIRQKQKYQEGGEKWEFLDDMAFLDEVISYRRKQWQIYDNYSTDSQFEQLSSDYDLSSETNQHAETSQNVKTEGQNSERHFLENYVADSTLDLSRKRNISESSDYLSKRERKCRHMKTTEDIFGEFVAAMLATKTEAGRNSAMIQITEILTKTK